MVKKQNCVVDTDSLIVYIKTDGIYKDVAKNIEIKFDILNYELNMLLPKGKNKKINWINER